MASLMCSRFPIWALVSPLAIARTIRRSLMLSAWNRSNFGLSSRRAAELRLSCGLAAA